MTRGKAHTRRINNWNKTNQGDYWMEVDDCKMDEEIITYLAGAGMLVIVCMVMAIAHI